VRQATTATSKTKTPKRTYALSGVTCLSVRGLKNFKLAKIIFKNFPLFYLGDLSYNPKYG
jgi:hypothetical protein